MPDYFHFPPLPERPTLKVSFEQELPTNAFDLGATLDLPASGYHGGHRNLRSPRIYIEEDGSCGAEIIYSMLPLDTPQGAERVRDTWYAAREACSRVNTACGFHVHVDPRPLDFTALQSLYHLWNGLEDVLYRIGGAGYRAGHRGTGYCHVTPKGLNRAAEIGSALRGGRGGLNMSRIVRVMLECSCGAAEWGSFSECICDSEAARAGTVEFRLWNGTRNARKGHAYIALSLGLIAEAKRIRYDARRVGTLPWNQGDVPAPSRLAKATERVLALPMTAFDRECVLYCIEASTIPGIAGPERMAAMVARFGGSGATSPEWVEWAESSDEGLLDRGTFEEVA